jgi:hypothetical protein
MAGVKITDLTPLGTSASDDLFYIVDVSDFTESPQGTSKQIEVGNMFSSGTFTPTISGETNGILVPSADGTYMKIGNIVYCSVLLEIQLAALQDTGSFEIELPVASDLTSQKQCIGVLQWSYGGFYDQIQGLTIGANLGNNTCEVGLLTKDQEALLQYCVLQFQYQVV